MGGSKIVGLGGDYEAFPTGGPQAMALFRKTSWLKVRVEYLPEGLCQGDPGDSSPAPLPTLQHLAHRKEGQVSQLTVHGLAGDAVPGPQASRRPDPREPGECAHLLLPVTPRLAIPAHAAGVGDKLELEQPQSGQASCSVTCHSI